MVDAALPDSLFETLSLSSIALGALVFACYAIPYVTTLSLSLCLSLCLSFDITLALLLLQSRSLSLFPNTARASSVILEPRTPT